MSSILSTNVQYDPWDWDLIFVSMLRRSQFVSILDLLFFRINSNTATKIFEILIRIVKHWQTKNISSRGYSKPSSLFVILLMPFNLLMPSLNRMFQAFMVAILEFIRNRQ